ncbi:MAG: hypothetical protein K0R51_2011 [Cytophagaceae bacterium]|jgi:hypothetical protein|nr:hypothetical protein [Cytophagaceae bacterium]
MANLHIEIPKPCPSSWSAMTANKEGRHCKACEKTVVDFTVMSDEAIKQYFVTKTGEKVCGRFYTHQVTPPYTGWQKKLIAAYTYVDHRVTYRMARVAALILLTAAMTLSGCGHKTTGESVPVESDDTLQNVSCDTASIVKGKLMILDGDQKTDSVQIKEKLIIGEASPSE